MFYIVEHDMKVNQIIDTKGKANKYGNAKLFDTEEDALYWLSKHKMGSPYGGTLTTYPFYEIRKATPEELKRWR